MDLERKADVGVAPPAATQQDRNKEIEDPKPEPPTRNQREPPLVVLNTTRQKRHRRKSLFPGKLDEVPVEVLYDTGADRSCVSGEAFDRLKHKPPLHKTELQVVSAGGRSLGPLGEATCALTLGGHRFTHTFLVLKGLKSEVIIGNDLQEKFGLGQSWRGGKMLLTKNSRYLICSLQLAASPTYLLAKREAVVPPRTCVNVGACVTGGTRFLKTSKWAKIQPNKTLESLSQVGTIHRLNGRCPKELPYMLINQTNMPITIPEGYPLATLEPLDENDYHIIECDPDEQVYYQEQIVKVGETTTDRLPVDPEGTAMMTSPAQIPTPVKPVLGDYNITPGTRHRWEKLCEHYSKVFSEGPTDIGYTKLITMEINTGDSPPIAQAPYRCPLKHRDWLRMEIERLRHAGIIEMCASDWASPVVIVSKKPLPGEPPQNRLCVDYRALNSLLPKVTNPTTKAKGILSMVPLPRIDDLLGRLNGAKIFTSLDCTQGYHHIGLSPESQLKSAFVTEEGGKFMFKKVPFGLAQAPAYFQLLMNLVLHGINFAFAYLDDILIFSKNEEEHLKHLQMVFQRLETAGLKLKKKKCDFFKAELQYLGHIISHEGMQPMKDKLEAIQKMPPPSTQKEVRQVLGLTGYYRKFIPHYANLVKPLTRLCRKMDEYIWEKPAQASFDALKEAMVSPPILRYPNPELPYVLYTDASKYAWGAVLMQAASEGEDKTKVKSSAKQVSAIEDKGYEKERLHPITYVSGQFQGSQLNWAALTKEAYAIYRAIKKLSFYVKGASVLLRTDHLPLKKFLQKNTASETVNNWAVELESYHITIEYVAGVKNTLADVLSRLVAEDITEPLEKEPYGYEYGVYIFEETPEEKARRLQKEKDRKERKDGLKVSLQAIQTEPVGEDVLRTLRAIEEVPDKPPPA